VWQRSKTKLNSMVNQEDFIALPKYEKDPKKEQILGQMEQFGIHLIIKDKGVLYKKRVEHGSHFLKEELQKLELLSEEPVIKSWQYQDVDPTRRD